MSMFKEFAMPPLVLTVIAAVVTGALVATESVTTPIIEQQAAAAADAARAVVLPSADSFTQVTVDEMPEGGVDIYEANNGTGYVVTAQAKGYGGMLKVMVGIDSNGLISGTEVLENNETQGLGSKVSEHAFLDQYIGKPTVTKDGVTIELVANIGKPADVDKVLQYDAEGIGLFRTESLFMDRNSMPTEDEQFEAYQKVAIAINGKPVIIRTLDIGGDKEIPYMGLKKDENPFLGYRAIRFCLDRREDVYRPQLRALLRASAFGNIKIMVPMVTCLEEFREAKAMIEEVKAELDLKGIAYKRDIQVGIMVETAAASLMADAFAKEVDFFSIGTNDLTQYTMSVDRGNDKVSYLYSPLNPAVLRSIRHIIQCGRKEGIMVGMCGEAASDPLMIPLLLAFGLNEFSMSASAVLNARKLITGYSIAELQSIADQAMSFVTAGEVEAYMREQQ